jgi:hypothetical protein
MAGNGLNKCLTGFLVCVNVLFVLFGLGLLTAGIYLLASQWKDVEPALMTKVGIGLIALGLFTIVLAVCGCCGALKKKKWMLRFYMVFVFIMMAVCGGLAFVLFQSEGTLKDIAAGNNSGSAEFNSLSDTLQSHFDNVYCSAVESQKVDAGKFSTWTNWVDNTCNPPAPSSAKAPSKNCNADGQCKNADGSNCAYSYCKKFIAQEIVNHLTPVAAGVASFAALLLFLIVASCGLCCYNKSQTLEEKYDGKGTFVEFY